MNTSGQTFIIKSPWYTSKQRFGIFITGNGGNVTQKFKSKSFKFSRTTDNAEPWCGQAGVLAMLSFIVYAVLCKMLFVRQKHFKAAV